MVSKDIFVSSTYNFVHDKCPNVGFDSEKSPKDHFEGMIKKKK